MVVKSGAAFERFGGIRHLAVDKTGTLTGNNPTVTRVVTDDGVSENEVLKWAASLEGSQYASACHCNRKRSE